MEKELKIQPFQNNEHIKESKKLRYVSLCPPDSGMTHNNPSEFSSTSPFLLCIYNCFLCIVWVIRTAFQHNDFIFSLIWKRLIHYTAEIEQETLKCKCLLCKSPAILPRLK